MSQHDSLRECIEQHKAKNLKSKIDGIVCITLIS